MKERDNQDNHNTVASSLAPQDGFTTTTATTTSSSGGTTTAAAVAAISDKDDGQTPSHKKENEAYSVVGGPTPDQQLAQNLWGFGMRF
jgi:hypothetical protein